MLNIHKEKPQELKVAKTQNVNITIILKPFGKAVLFKNLQS